MHQGDRWLIAGKDVNKIDQNNTRYVIEVIEVGKAVDSRNHLELAQALKLEGNAFIKQKDNAKAAAKYQQAYDLVVNDPTNKAY